MRPVAGGAKLEGSRAREREREREREIREETTTGRISRIDEKFYYLLGE